MIKVILALCIVLAIITFLLTSYDTPHHDNIETFRDATATETCALHNVIDAEFCRSEYANMGRLQLYYAIRNLTNNPAKKEMLQRAYNIKKENDIFHIPCKYSLDKLRQTSGNNIPTKSLNDPQKNSNKGQTFSWANCYYDGNDIQLEGVDEKNPAIYVEPRYNKVIFNKMDDINDIKGIVCSAKNIGNFYAYNDPCNNNSGAADGGCYYLRVKLSMIELDDANILVDSIRVVKWDSNKGRFEEVSNMNLLKGFFTLTYDTNVVKYIPLQKTYSFHVFSNDMCGGYSKEFEDTAPFHIGMIGYDQISLTTAIKNININKAGLPDSRKMYETDTTLTIVFRRANLLELLEKAEKQIAADKASDYKSCMGRYKQTQRRLTSMKMRKLMNADSANSYIDEYANKIKQIRRLIKQLYDFGETYGKDRTGCDNQIDNSVALDLMKTHYTSCKATMLDKGLPTKPLDDFITKASEVLGKSQFNVSEADKTEMLKLITKADTPEINANCVLAPKVKSVRKSKLIINNLSELIRNSEITDSTLNELDDMDMALSNMELLKYASMDDCLYILL